MFFDPWDQSSNSSMPLSTNIQCGNKKENVDSPKKKKCVLLWIYSMRYGARINKFGIRMSLPRSLIYLCVRMSLIPTPILSNSFSAFTIFAFFKFVLSEVMTCLFTFFLPAPPQPQSHQLRRSVDVCSSRWDIMPFEPVQFSRSVRKPMARWTAHLNYVWKNKIGHTKAGIKVCARAFSVEPKVQFQIPIQSPPLLTTLIVVVKTFLMLFEKVVFAAPPDRRDPAAAPWPRRRRSRGGTGPLPHHRGRWPRAGGGNDIGRESARNKTAQNKEDSVEPPNPRAQILTAR